MRKDRRFCAFCAEAKAPWEFSVYRDSAGGISFLLQMKGEIHNENRNYNCNCKEHAAQKSAHDYGNRHSVGDGGGADGIGIPRAVHAVVCQV